MEDSLGTWEDELRRLELAREREFAVRGPPNTARWEKRWRRMLELQRHIAGYRGEEYAESIRLGVPLGFEWNAVLGFGTATLLAALDRPADLSVAIKFDGVQGTKMEALNDEVFEEHPMYGRGLDIMGPHVVVNSGWRAAIHDGMKSHPSYKKFLWDRMKHFLFRDKGGDFHCLASGFTVVHLAVSISDLRRLLSEMVDSATKQE